jgi:hypothetical protein
MVTMAKSTKRGAKSEKPKRNVVFVTLDEATEAALQRFLAAQRIPPERSAVGFAAIVEFLSKEGYPPYPKS